MPDRPRTLPFRSTGGRIDPMSKPTSIKTSEDVRDRLRVLAEERGTTITELLEELASRELTRAERDERAAEAARELGVEYSDQVQQAGRAAWARIRAHQGGAAA
ncbi:ribbon-helix-helix domain-containing protein [Streptomyces coelicoflavus]